MAAKKKKKNSLVENISRRKRAGKSRPKSRSTISPSAYADMQEGWPRKKKAKRNGKRSAARGSSAARARLGKKKAQRKQKRAPARKRTGGTRARKR